jgi:hypothetical protein
MSEAAPDDITAAAHWTAHLGSLNAGPRATGGGGGSMTRKPATPPIDTADLSDAEMELLAQAFTALRQERGRAWNAACDIAEAQGKRRPALKPYGIDDIRRLARRFGIRKTHPRE